MFPGGDCGGFKKGSGLDSGLKSISTIARKLVYKGELSSAESGLQ